MAQQLQPPFTQPTQPKLSVPLVPNASSLWFGIPLRLFRRTMAPNQSKSSNAKTAAG